MSNKKVETSIKVDASTAIKNINSLIASLEKVNQTATKTGNITVFANITNSYDKVKQKVEKPLKMSIDDKVNKEITKMSNSFKEVDKAIDKIDGVQSITNDIKVMDAATEGAEDTFKKLDSALSLPNIAIAVQTIKEMATFIADNVSSAASFAENVNLMEVAFADTKDEASSLINYLSDMIGLDVSALSRQLGFYRQIGASLAINAEYADLLATNLLKMQLDVASLYNLSFEKSGEVLQASLAGQTKPIRGSTGADITQATLQTDLDRLGINESITNLNRAEKAILIYLSLERQLINSNKDLAKTINSTANQQKIMAEQVKTLGRNIGAVLSPAFTTLLIIANGVLMVINELISAFATFVGFEIPDYGNVANTFEDLDSILGDSNDEIDEMDKKLRGFDKLNVITTPSDTSGSGSGIGGVDQSLLDAINEYDLGLDNMNNKATKVRDTLMEWLGYTKLINEETGEISWEFEKFTLGTLLGGIASLAIMYTALVSISKLLKFIGITSKPLPSLFALLGQIWTAVLFPAIKAVVVAIAGFFGTTVGWVVAIGVAIVAALALIWIFRDEIINAFKVMGEWLMTYVINPIIDFFTMIASFVWKNAIQPIIEFFKPIAEAIINITTLIFKNVAEIVIGVGKAIWDILSKIGEIFLKIVEIFVALGKAGYDYVIKPILSFVGEIATFIYQKAIKPIFDFIISIGTTIYNKLIKPLWDNFVWLKNKVVDIFEGVITTIIDFGTNIFKGIVNAIFVSIETFINFFIKALNKAIGAINKIPGVELEKLSLLEIQKFEDGGFPEDGWFRASHGEMIGKFDNGQNVVANNQQITEGIRNATKNGMIDALMIANKDNNQKVEVTIVAEDGGLLDSINFKQKERDRQYN